MKNKDMTTHFWKIYNCINSCTSKIQLESCTNMVNTFKSNFSKIDIKVAIDIFNKQINYREQMLIQ